MKKLLFGLGLLIPFLLSAQQVPRSVTASNGTFIGFYEYKPPVYNSNPSGKFPLIIFLHGIGERGDGSSTLSSVLNVGIPRNIHYGLTDMQFNYNGSTQGFLVLSPQLSYNYGNWQPFYIQEMIKYAKANLRVDTNRIYLTGLSLGGGGVWNYASSSAAAAKGLAAIAPICATCDWSGLNNIAQQALPVWAFHAMDDGVVGVGCTQAALSGINAYNPIVAPQATYYPTGNHWIWDQVYDPTNPQLYLWFLSKSRGSSTPPPPTGGNVAPVANAGNAQTITLPNNSVNLSGTGSYDSDGTITNYTWSQAGGPGTASFVNPNVANTSVGGLVQGTYTFKLTVTDNAGSTNSSTVNITVNGAAPPSNTPPVAVTSGNQTITLPANSAFLLGSGSYDAGGYITNYAWTQESGPNTASVTAMNSNLDVKNMVAGTYVFKLTVTDNGGATNSATATITVGGTAPPPPPGGGGGAGAPFAVASANQTITLPTNSVFLLGSGSYDVGGYITNYAWTQESGPGSSVTTAMGSNLDVKNLIGGTYVFKLTVTDNSGQTGTTTTTVTVNGGTPPPPPGGGGGAGAPFAVASANQTITLPNNSVFLLGSGSYDVGGYITNYAWSQQSGPNTASITTMGSNLDVKNMVGGTYVFKLTVTDNSGQTGTTTTTVTVNGGTPPPPPPAGGGGAGSPTAVAGANQYISLPTSAVYLMGGGSYDVGGWITNFAWSQESGPSTATLTSVNPSNVEAKNLISGTYTFRLTVTDNSGLTGTSTMQVIVSGSSARTTSIPTTELTGSSLVSNAVSTTSTPTTLVKAAVANSLSLYPNPVTTTMNVELNNDITGNITINVVNSAGTVVKSIKTSKSSYSFAQQVNMQDVKAGTYVVEIRFADGTRLSGQVVKQ